MKMPHGLRFGLGLGLLMFAVLCIPGTIINYTNIKQVWVLILGPSLFVTTDLASLFLLIFVNDEEPIIEKQQPKEKPQKEKRTKNKKPFISDKEWEELDEEDEEEMYIVEDD